jgi:hypothetical protein
MLLLPPKSKGVPLKKAEITPIEPGQVMLTREFNTIPPDSILPFFISFNTFFSDYCHVRLAIYQGFQL